MVGVVIKVPPARAILTGVAFSVYAERYRDAAVACLRVSKSLPGFDPVPYQLLCQALERHLKSFVWLKDHVGVRSIKSKYGHDLEKLWCYAKARGIGRYVATTDLRNECIAIVGPYYRKRQFNYLDIHMLADGYRQIRAHPKILPALSRMTKQLGKSLQEPILKAS